MHDNELLEQFRFECIQQLDALDALLFASESAGCFSPEDVAEQFRLLHTIKGSAGMMGFGALSDTAHSAENLFQFLRSEQAGLTLSAEQTGQTVRCVLECTAYLRDALERLDGSTLPQGSPALEEKLSAQLTALRGGTMTAERILSAASDSRPADLNGYAACRIFFVPCSAPALRAYMVRCAIMPLCRSVYTVPNELKARPELDTLIQTRGLSLGSCPIRTSRSATFCTGSRRRRWWTVRSRWSSRRLRRRPRPPRP